jgi:zinc protease
MPRPVTFSPIARAVLALAIGGTPIAAGCGHAGAGGPGAVAGGEPSAAIPPVRAETRLPSGVRVVVEENHLAPLVAIQVWVAAGAADDPPALAGAAHLYEHLVLRGGKRRGPGGGAREIEAVRGSVGGWTGLDETVYHAVVAAPFFELGLDVLADALANPTFDPAEIERARKLALDEIAGSAADPRLRANQALFASAFAGHGYARPVMGSAASVAALTPAALAAHYADGYAAGALTVVVVGDVDSHALAAVERAFGGIALPGRPQRADGGRGKMAASPARVAVTAGPGSPSEVIVGFRTPALSARDAAALDLLAAVLARGDGSRMQRDVVRNRQLADAVRPFSFRSREAGLVAFSVTPSPRRIAQAAEATLDLALRAATEPATAAEIEGARAAVESDLARAGEGPLARARRLGFAAAIAGGADDAREYLETIRRIGAGELQQFAVELLNPEHLTVAVASPDAPGGRDEAAAALSTRLQAIVAAAPALAARHAAPATPAVGSGDAARFVTPAGVRVVVLGDGSAPLVSVQAAWVDRGDALDRAADDAAPLIAALLERGTRTRSAADVAGEARAIGGTLKGFAAPGALGLRADFLPRHLGRGLALVTDCLAHPAFAEPEIDAAERALVMRARDDQRGSDAAARAALRLFRDTVWPDAARAADGAAAPVAGRFALLDRYRRRYPASRLIVAVVGNVDPAAVAAALADAFSAASPSPPAPAAPSPAPATSSSPLVVAPAGQGEGPSLTVFRTAPGPDAAAVIGYPAVGPGDAGRAPIDVLAEILGGEGGRIAAAVAGEKTLACRAGAQVPGAAASGYLAVTVSCPPAHLDAAVAAVRAALARTAAAGITPDEVSLASRRLIGVRAAALRTRMAVADALVRDEAAGLPILAYRRATAALARVAPADVARAAQAVLDPRREVVAVVHPPSAAPALARTAANVNRTGKPESER